MKYLLLLILVSFHTILFSQTHEIRGKVADVETSEFIVYATITIYNNTNLLGGTVTDKKGMFSIKLNGSFTHIKVSFMGYEPKIIQAHNIKSNQILNIELLLDENSLDEVILKGKTVTTKTTIDRKIINLGNDLQQSGVTALEAFEQIPEIQADIASGTVSLRGSDNINVLVNGKISPLNVIELLQQIPSSNIKKIEIITSPSVKYNANGLSGIINVILNKNKNIGLNMSLNSTAGRRRYGLGLDGNYNADWINFRLNASKSHLKTINKQKIQREYSTGSKETIYTPYEFDGSVTNLTLGLDLFINDNHGFSLDFTYTDDNHTNNNSSYFTNVTNRDDYVLKRLNSHHHYINIFNANYRLKFKNEKHFLELDYNRNDSENNYPLFDFENDEQLSQQLLTEDFNLQSLAVDYSVPINENTLIEAGVFRNTQELGSTNLFIVLNTFPNETTYSTFDYKETVLGAYGSTKFRINKFQFQTGLRYEYFKSNSNISITNFTTHQTFSNIFPSVHISYPFTEKDNLNFGYSKRISRPDFHQINVFQIVNPLFVWEYTPNIQPEFSDNFDLNYQRNTKNINLSLSTFYRFKRDAILWTEFSENNQQIFKYINAGSFHTYGVETSILIRLKPRWSSRLTGNFYFTKIDEKQYVTWDKQYSASIQFKNTVKINNTVSFDATYFYNPKRQNAFSYDRHRKRLDIALKGKFFGNKVTLGMRVIDVFNENHFIRKSKTNNLTQITNWDIQNLKRNFLFSADYKLFERSLKPRKRKKRRYNQAPID